MMRPLPPQRWHGPVDANTPSGVCLRVWTVPLPWHSGQVSGELPGSQPLPLQVSQATYRSTVTAFSQPKAASSKVMARDWRILSPRWGALGLERRCAPPKPPPKKLPKMSPRSPKSKPAPPYPPPAPKLGSTPAWPY